MGSDQKSLTQNLDGQMIMKLWTWYNMIAENHKNRKNVRFHEDPIFEP